MLDTPNRRHWIVMAAVLAVTLATTVYAATAALAVKDVSAARPFALLAERPAESRALLNALGERKLNTALTASPLDQRLVDVAMVRDVDRHGQERTGHWIGVIERLGWRDTTALQNRLYVAAQDNDLNSVIDIVDAMLRRRKLTDELIGALSSAEVDPASRIVMVNRLVDRPNWRGVYLTTTEQLKTADQLRARYQLLGELQRRGSPIAANEAALNIIAAERVGLHDLGFSLWRSTHPHSGRPLDDAHFSAAGESLRRGIDETPIPYQWQILVGEGFRADVSGEGRNSALEIDWDGRGVPVFAQQRLSGSGGAYTMTLDTSTANAADLSAFDFRLACHNVTVPLRRQSPGSKSYVSDQPVPCAYPLFQIAGGIRGAATQRHLVIPSIDIRAPSLAPVSR